MEEKQCEKVKETLERVQSESASFDLKKQNVNFDLFQTVTLFHSILSFCLLRIFETFFKQSQLKYLVNEMMMRK